MTALMKAWQLGAMGIENLELVQRAIPAPGAREVLVRIGAVALNYRDKLVVQGALLPEKLSLPFTPVSDMAGAVVAVGPAVSRFKLGDRISGQFWTGWIDGPPPADLGQRGLGGPLPGVLAEYVVLHEDFAVRAPACLADAESACLPIAYLTAWFALMEVGRLRPEQTVLVQGTGGVSLAGLQIAHAVGARTILTTRNPAKMQLARRLGAWKTIDASSEREWASRVLELTEGRGVDHVLDVLGGDNLAQSVSAIADGGTIAQIGFLESPEGTVPILPLMMKHVRLQGITVGHRRAFEEMIRFIDANGLKPVVDRAYDFDDAPAAFARLDEGPFGKVVVRVGS